MNREEPDVVKHILTRMAPIILGIALFLILLYWCGFEQMTKLKGGQAIPFVMALLATVGVTSTLTWRWRSILAVFEGKALKGTWFEFYRIVLLTRVLSHVLPKDLVDIGVRTLWLKKQYKQPLLRGSISVLLDRLMDAYTAAVLLLGTIPFWQGTIADWGAAMIAITVAALLGGFILLVFGPLIIKSSLGVYQWWKTMRRQEGIKGADNTKFLEPSNIQKKQFLLFYLLSILKTSFLAVQLIMFAKTFSIPISPLTLVMGIPISQVSFIFAFAPGGLGVLEAGWLAMLLLKGVPKGTISLFLLVQRIMVVLSVTVLLLLIETWCFVFHKTRNFAP